jgi:hypothetical protein
MRKYLTAIWIFVTINVYSQKDMFIDIHVMPLHSYRDINTTNSLWNDILLNKLDSIEQPSTGLSYGISYEFSLTKRFHFSTGLDRTILNEKITRDFINFNENFQLTRYSETFYNKYEYIGVPLKITYSVISNSHWNIGFAGSMRVDILTQYEIEKYSLRNDNSLSSWTYNKWTLCSSAGFHFEYGIKRFSFYINPEYYRYLTTNAEYNFVNNTNYLPDGVDTEIKQHNYYFGLLFGIKYRINNR